MKDKLDKRICDVVDGAENTQTYREFIIETENMLGIPNQCLDDTDSKEIEEYIDWLDEMWGK